MENNTSQDNLVNNTEYNIQNNKVQDYASIVKDESTAYQKDTDIDVKKDVDDDGFIPNKKILAEIAGIAVPTILFYFCLIIQQTILIAFISAQYKDEVKQEEVINGIGNANLYMNCTLISFVIGTIGGFNVLAGNAFGQKKYYLFGLYFHRAIIVCCAFSVIICTVHSFTMQYGFAFLGAEGEANEFAVKFARISMFYVFFEVLFNVSYRYLNIAKKGIVIIIVLIVTTALHPLWCYLFINVFDLGIEGGAISIVLSQALTGISLILFIVIKKPIKNTIFCFRRDSFRSIGAFLKISIPNALLLMLEWWAFELQQVVVTNSGREDWRTQLSVQILSANIFSCFYSLSVGIVISSAIITSKYIAQKRLSEFQRAALLNLSFGIILVAFFILISSFFRDKIFGIFTTHDDIIQAGKPVYLYIMTTIFFNIIKSSLTGVLIGMRMQIFASIVSFCTYYILMMGLSVLFVDFLDWGVEGVWIAESIGYCFISIVFIATLLLTDKNKVIENTLAKLKKDQDDLKKLMEEENLNENEVSILNENDKENDSSAVVEPETTQDYIKNNKKSDW